MSIPLTKKLSNLILIGSFYLVFLSSSSLSAKSYQITKIHIQAALHPYSRLDVVESLEYTFSDRFRVAHRKLTETDSIRLNNFQVSENTSSFTISESAQPGTFQVIKNSKGMGLKWFFVARNEARTFFSPLNHNGVICETERFFNFHYSCPRSLYRDQFFDLLKSTAGTGRSWSSEGNYPIGASSLHTCLSLWTIRRGSLSRAMESAVH